MLKFSGHTMGTPDLDIGGAMRLFGGLGYDGIEIRVGEEGTIRPADLGPDLADRINALREETGLEVACLTPYFRQFHVPAEREGEMAGMRQVVEFATLVGCPVVRSFAAKNPPMEGPEHETARAAWVEAMAQLGREADQAGVAFAIESHGGTFCPTLAETVRLVEDLGLDSVGVLMDYANVYEHGPCGAEAVRLVEAHLKHVHMKDKRVTDGGSEFADFGEGNIGWPAVLAELVAIGYEGYVSDEYERWWHRELPPAETAMKQHIDWLRAWRDANT